MFLKTTKSDCWKRSATRSMSLSNALKFKTDTNLLLIDGDMAELRHPNVLLIDVGSTVSSTSIKLCYIRLQLVPNLNIVLRLKIVNP